MSVKYTDPYTAKIVPVPRRGMLQLAPGQSPDGYGKKISTDRMIQFNGDKKWYRVYAVCFSNAASHYIIRNKETLFLRGGDLDQINV
jgi:hypothetical protein